MRFSPCPIVERLVDKTRKNGGNESFEANALGIDGYLVGVGRLHDRIHLGAQKLAMAGLRIDACWIGSGVLFVNLDRLFEDDVPRKALVAEIWIIDARLVVRNHLARGAEHVGKAPGDGCVVIGGSTKG